jgi:hypothetical protein
MIAEQEQFRNLSGVLFSTHVGVSFAAALAVDARLRLGSLGFAAVAAD